MNQVTELEPTLPKTHPQSLKITIIAAVSMFIVDAVVFHVVGFSIYAAIVAIFWLIPASMHSLIKGSRDIGLFRFKKAMIYLITALAVVIAFTLNNRLAERRAEVVIAAVEKFHEQKGRYPNSLKELVPEYMETVPLANLTLHGTFIYYTSNERPTFGYFRFGSLARRYYSFKGRNWYTID